MRTAQKQKRLFQKEMGRCGLVSVTFRHDGWCLLHHGGGSFQEGTVAFQLKETWQFSIACTDWFGLELILPNCFSTVLYRYECQQYPQKVRHVDVSYRIQTVMAGIPSQNYITSHMDFQVYNFTDVCMVLLTSVLPKIREASS